MLQNRSRNAEWFRVEWAKGLRVVQLKTWCPRADRKGHLSPREKKIEFDFRSLLCALLIPGEET